MDSDFTGPVNIGSEEMISINRLAEMTMAIAGKRLSIRNVPGPEGVRGRNSDNRLIREKLGWAPSQPLRAGIEKTYRWVKEQVERARVEALLRPRQGILATVASVFYGRPFR
jgi:nucleoside-diphosphate-sugar epimerase